MSEGIAPADSTRPRWVRLTLGVAIFVLVGPPVGGLMMALLSHPGAGGFRIETLPTVITFSYLLGGIQALVTGIGTALAAWRRGATSLWHPVLVILASHLLVTLAVIIASLVVRLPLGGLVSYLLVLSPLLSLPAALICWFIARPLLRAR